MHTTYGGTKKDYSPISYSSISTGESDFIILINDLLSVLTTVTAMHYLAWKKAFKSYSAEIAPNWLNKATSASQKSKCKCRPKQNKGSIYLLSRKHTFSTWRWLLEYINPSPVRWRSTLLSGKCAAVARHRRNWDNDRNVRAKLNMILTNVWFHPQ